MVAKQIIPADHLLDHLALAFKKPLGLVSPLPEGLVRQLYSCFGQDESLSRVLLRNIGKIKHGTNGLSCETHTTTESGYQVSGVAVLVMHAISQCNLTRADQEWRNCIGSA